MGHKHKDMYQRQDTVGERLKAYPNQEAEVLFCTQIAIQRMSSRRQKPHTTPSTT